MDVAIDKELADLTLFAVTSRWFRYLENGRAIGVLGGPLCETWRADRWHGDQRRFLGYGGPPPFRAVKHVWGHPDVTMKQHEQRMLGTQSLICVHIFLLQSRRSLRNLPSLPRPSVSSAASTKLAQVFSPLQTHGAARVELAQRPPKVGPASWPRILRRTFS